MVAASPRLDEVWLVALDPTSRAEIRKTRPCLIISPNEMNLHLRTTIIAPMTTAERPYPTRRNHNYCIRFGYSGAFSAASAAPEMARGGVSPCPRADAA